MTERVRGQTDRLTVTDLDRVILIIRRTYEAPPRGVEYKARPVPARGGKPGATRGHPWNLQQGGAWIRMRLLFEAIRLKARAVRREALQKRRRAVAAERNKWKEYERETWAPKGWTKRRDEKIRLAAAGHPVPRVTRLVLADLKAMRLWAPDAYPQRSTWQRWARDYKGDKVTERELHADILRIHRRIKRVLSGNPP